MARLFARTKYVMSYHKLPLDEAKDELQVTECDSHVIRRWRVFSLVLFILASIEAVLLLYLTSDNQKSLVRYVSPVPKCWYLEPCPKYFG
jgi:hypothetical protein